MSDTIAAVVEWRELCRVAPPPHRPNRVHSAVAAKGRPHCCSQKCRRRPRAGHEEEIGRAEPACFFGLGRVPRILYELLQFRCDCVRCLYMYTCVFLYFHT